MEHGTWLRLASNLILITCLIHAINGASILTSQNEPTKNKTDKIISNQIIDESTTQLIDQIAEESSPNRGIIKFAPSQQTPIETSSQNELSTDDRSEYGRFFDVDKYVSPEFHNVNNVFNSDSGDMERFTSSEVYDDMGGPSHKVLDPLTTPKTASFDERHKQIQQEINENMKYYDSFTTSQRPKFSLKEHGIKKENIEYQKDSHLQLSDSISSGTRHLDTTSENRTQLHTQNEYLDHVSDDNKENELDYATPRSRTRFSLRNNKVATDNTSEESEEKVKKPTVKWKPFYLSTQTPTSIDPISEENVSERVITIAKRGSTKFADTISTPNDGLNFTIPPSATAWSLTSLKAVTPRLENGSTSVDSVIEENQLYSVRVLAPSTTPVPNVEELETSTRPSTTPELTTTNAPELTETTLAFEPSTTESTRFETTTLEVTTSPEFSTTTQSVEELDVTSLNVAPTTYRPPLNKRRPIEETTTIEYSTTISNEEGTTEVTETTTEPRPTSIATAEISTETTRNIRIEASSESTTEIPTTAQMETTTKADVTTTSSLEALEDTKSTTVVEKIVETTEKGTTKSETTTEAIIRETDSEKIAETEPERITETSPLFSPTLRPEVVGSTEVPVTTVMVEVNRTDAPEKVQSPIIFNVVDRKVSTTELPHTIQESTIKTGKSNDLLTSDEEFDIRIKLPITTPTTPIPENIATTGFNYKTIDNKLTDTNPESIPTQKIPKTTSIFSSKQPSSTFPVGLETSTLSPSSDPKFGHKTNENDIFKHPTPTVPEQNYKNAVSDEETSSGTTTTTEYPESGGMGDGYDDSPGAMPWVVMIIVAIAATCLVLVSILLIIMRKRQKRFNYGQRCTPVSLDAYSLDSVSVYNSVRRKAIRASKRSYGNPAFEDTDNISRPLNFSALAAFANNTQAIAEEYDEIPVIAGQASEVPAGCESKNRYANVIPLPETRVYLTKIDREPNSEYINANFVRGPKNAKAYYIATQAPLENTIDDFWRMIWEQQSKLIIQLTDLYENGVEKCFNYLPPSEVLDCNRQFGDFQITLKNREVKEKYITHTIQLKNMVSNCWREVTHMWYLGWPERGTPTEVDSLVALLIEARSYTKVQTNTLTEEEKLNGSANGSSNEITGGNSGLVPIVVHCSPGTGRTGAVIACDILMREFELTRLVDIPKLVYRIRRDRAGAVQTRDQYAYIYKMINVYATKLTGGALDSI